MPGTVQSHQGLYGKDGYSCSLLQPTSQVACSSGPHSLTSLEGEAVISLTVMQ